MASDQAGAHDDVGDGDAEEDIQDHGEAGVFEAVLDGGEGHFVAEGEAEVVEREGGGKNGAVPVTREGDENDANVGEDGDKEDGAEEEGAEGANDGTGGARASLAGGLGHHGVGGAPEGELAGGVEEDGRGEHDGDQGVGERVAADVLDAVEDLNGGNAGEVKHQGDAEFGERPDKDDGPAGKEAGHDEGEGDAEKFAQPGAAEVLGRLLHGGVDVGEGGDDVEVDDGVEIEGDHGGDAPELALTEPVNGSSGILETEMDEEGVQRALLAENLADADGADEGGQDHRDENEGAEEGFAGEKEAVRDPSQGKSEKKSQGCGKNGEEERVPQAFEVDGVTEDLKDVGEGEVAIAIEEGPAEGFADREKEKAGEKGDGESKDRDRKGFGHGWLDED